MICTRTTHRARARAGSGRWTWALLAMVLALVSSGCDDDEERAVSCPCDTATLSGRLLNDAGPVAGRVWAHPTSQQADPYYDHYAQVDEDGRYELKVPAGTYRLTADDDSWELSSWYRCYYATDGPTLSETEAETLAVSAGEVRSGLDFRLSRVELTVHAPAEFEGSSGMLTLRPGGGSARETPWGPYEVHTGIQGGTMNFTWPAVVPGTYQAVLAMVFPPESMRLLAAPDEDPDSDRLVVDPAVLVRHEATLLDPPAQISGIVAGAWSELGSERAQVEAVAADSSLACSASLEKAGPFLLELHGAGTVRLRVRIGGVERWVGGADHAHATQFVLMAGTVIEDMTIADCGLRVGLAGAGPQLDEGVRLTVHERASGALVAQTVGESSPILTIANLIPGEYLLRVEPEWPFTTGWIPHWYDRASSMASAAPITLAEVGDIAQVTVELQPGGVIQGVVGRAPLRSSQGWAIVATTAEDADPLGSLHLHPAQYDFALRGLPDGDYRIGAWIRTRSHIYEPSDVTWYPGTPDWEAASVISIRAAGTVSGIDFTLPR